MPDTFISEAITTTRTVATRMEVTFCDGTGKSQTISMTPSIASALSTVLQDFSRASCSEGLLATKLPKQFAVGSGRYEHVVLVRFEDEAPYALNASQAAKLGNALVEEAELMAGQSAPLFQ